MEPPCPTNTLVVTFPVDCIPTEPLRLLHRTRNDTIAACGEDTFVGPMLTSKRSSDARSGCAGTETDATGRPPPRGARGTSQVRIQKYDRAGPRALIRGRRGEGP